MDTKSEHAFKELDKARANGQWAAVPELIKRYKKYHPTETVLPATAQIEYELVQLIQQQEKSKSANPFKVTIPSPATYKIEARNNNNKSTSSRNSFIVFTPPPELFNTTSSSVPHIPTLSASLVHPLLSRLEEVVAKQLASDDLETPDDWQAQLSKVLLARIYFESGRYKKALESLERLALRFEDVNWGYGLVLLVQARVIKGICFEMENLIPDALEAYDAAWEVVESHLNEKSDTIFRWVEDALYRSILLRTYQNAPVRQTLKSMRAYLQLASTRWSSQWRPQNRWNVLSLYTQYLTKVYQENTYIPMSTTSANESTVSLAQIPGASYAALYDELVTVTSRFRQSFPHMCNHLSTKEAGVHALELTSLIFMAHDVVGWGDLNNIRKNLEFLYYAKEKTFNSPYITRLIFFTLMRLGDLDEAKYALRAYLETVGLSDVDKTESSGIEVTPNGILEVTEKAELILKRIKLLSEMSDAGTADYQEDEFTVIQVLLAAVLLYGRELEQGELASNLADVALELARESGNSKIDTELLAKCYRTHGAAYGLRASQSDDPEVRSELHGDSLHSLNKAVELQPSWDSYYELAVQQAQMRDISGSVSSVLQALQLKSDHLPSYHLLALLSTSKQIHQFPKALQAVEAGLKATDINQLIPISSNMPMMSWSDEANSHEQFDQAEAYLTIRMTQIQLLETLEGSEAVLKLYGDLFTIYSKLSLQLGLKNGELHAATVQQSSSNEYGYTSSQFMNIGDNGSAANENMSSSTSTTTTANNTKRRASFSSRSRSRSRSISSNHNQSLDNSDKQSIATTATATTNNPAANGAPKSSNSEEIISNRKPSEDKNKPKDKKKRSIIDMRLGKRIQSVSSMNNSSSTNSIAEKQTQGSSTPVSSKALLDNVSLASMVAPSFSSLNSRRGSDAVTLFNYNASSVDKENGFGQKQRERWNSLVVKLWIMCTSSFIKSDRLDEAVHAITEAEEIGLTDADVWHQLGLLCLRAYELNNKTNASKWNKDDQEYKNNEELYDTALDAFKKALAIQPNHVPTHVDMAKAWIEHKETPQWELAEALLDNTTKSLGWDNEEAWYLLALAHRHRKSLERSKECLLYALQLSETKPLRSFKILPRFV
ncbi:hypothetical protein BJ944DRAFT_198193 [Cunninghamella echinulata]|nr:hypothetical protein BJ944DRAFT_198193 [Cunninghamella echinulata]